MYIGLHDAEYDHMPKKTFPNYALMKISAFHKSKGDIVEWWNPICNGLYDLVYSSKVFDFTPENPYLPPNTKKGGTGYGIFEDLPTEIDEQFPDYTIYPECDYAIGFITRGCPNKCAWCYVPKKEGNIRPYRDWKQLVRPDSNKLVLMDNNILACDYGIEQIEDMCNKDIRIDFNQGMDARLVTKDIVKLFKDIKWIRYIRFSCDQVSQLPAIFRVIDWFEECGISLSKIFIYLLVRKDVADAEYRVREITKRTTKVNIYAQAERNQSLGIVPNAMQLEFCNRYIYGRCYKKEKWSDYIERKNKNI